jgi:hypothetical protein
MCESESSKRVDASLGVEHAEGATSSQPSLVNATCPVTPAAASTAAAATDNAAFSEIKTGPAAIAAAKDVAKHANIANKPSEVMRLSSIPLCPVFRVWAQARLFLGCGLSCFYRSASADWLSTSYSSCSAHTRSTSTRSSRVSRHKSSLSCARTYTHTGARACCGRSWYSVFTHTHTHTHMHARTHTHTH